jgi:predicted CoA-substrate-specific enzyme activase
MVRIGIDIGAQNVYAAVLAGEAITETWCERHRGNIDETLARIFDRLSPFLRNNENVLAGMTGVTGRGGIPVTDTVLCLAAAAERFSMVPVRHILSVGCENSILIDLNENGAYLGHSRQGDCAAGTGGFIDQQALRLGMDAGTLSETAASFSGAVPTIATRCAVFAKSDMIHAQAGGYGPSAIAAGLCEGMARSIVAGTSQGRDLDGPVLFVGGVSANRAIAKALENSFGQPVHVPDHARYYGALGAALMADHDPDLIRKGFSEASQKRDIRDRLMPVGAGYPDFSKYPTEIRNGVEVTSYPESGSESGTVFVGIDVGSTSTKAVVLSSHRSVLFGLYTRTKGNPVQAVKDLLDECDTLFEGGRFAIGGVVTTGSGRDLVRNVYGADFSLNEITAHAMGACFIDPLTDTIIEIGGQDSKFTLMSHGGVSHAAMNYVCAAGTGSFIEEQAARLDIALEDIPAVTMGKEAPFTSDRCTVYMERDLNALQAEGWDKRQMMAAVLFSVRDNYMSKVVGKTPMGKRIYFQGATARNEALVAAFAQDLSQDIHVSHLCHLTGALGAAVAAQEAGIGTSSFAGTKVTCNQATEACDLCPNACRLSVYDVNGRISAWGMKCGKDYNERSKGEKTSLSRLETDFRTVFGNGKESVKDRNRPRILMPEVVFMSEFGTLFEDFLTCLGYRVQVVRGSETALKHGSRVSKADFCAPMVMACGVMDLLKKTPDLPVFFPAVVSAPSTSIRITGLKPLAERVDDNATCYYSSYAPLLTRAEGHDGAALIMPALSFYQKSVNDMAEDLARQTAFGLKRTTEEVVLAFTESWRRFLARKNTWSDMGKNILSAPGDTPVILVMGRPYVLFDERMNQGIPAKLETLGFPLVTQSMAPAAGDEENVFAMHWHYGREMRRALALMTSDPRIYPVFLTCFRCSPDSYLISEFKEAMAALDRPYLVLQLDEHGSDVGYQTRIEAAADTFGNHFKTRHAACDSPQVRPKKTETEAPAPGDTVYIPYTDGIINRLHAAVFEKAGYDGRVLGLTRQRIHLGYRFASGGECLPNVAILGSLLDELGTGRTVPEKTFLYLPTLCLTCNYAQYPALIRRGLDQAGYGEVRLLTFLGNQPIPGLSARYNALLAGATMLGSILHKLGNRYRPYESQKGDTDRLLETAERIAMDHIMARKSLLKAAQDIRNILPELPNGRKRKPKIAIVGDMYAKYNAVLNDRINDLVEELGGEILIPSYNELVIHALHADAKTGTGNSRESETMFSFERQFEEVFAGVLTDQFEPSPEECDEVMNRHGIVHPVPGETAISIGRMLHLAEKGDLAAVIHVNPIFCCPGVVSSALFKKLSKDTGVPVIDLFYDGSNRPNRRIVPHMYYAGRRN